MAAKDPHRFSNQLDEATTRRLIDRLESRSHDAVFTRLFDQYVEKLPLDDSTRVLEIGCGTGAIIRALARRADFSGSAVGVDQSPAFIEAAGRFADSERIGDAVGFKVGDAHNLGFADESFDIAIAHTLISHVTDPELVLNELSRVIRKGGTLVVFDGDYASLTFAFPDSEFGRKMDHALARATFNNPLVMRNLIHLLPKAGFEIIETLANAVSEVGSASYFKSFADTYAPLVASGGLLPQEQVENWISGQNEAMSSGKFFASCNYYTYLCRRL